HGPNRAERIGDALAGDVRRGAVNRLEQARAVAEAGAGEQADRAGQHGCGVGEDVAEQVRGHHDVETFWGADQIHRRRVDVLMFQGNIRIFRLVQVLDGLAPQLRDLEHVGLVDAHYS